MNDKTKSYEDQANAYKDENHQLENNFAGIPYLFNHLQVGSDTISLDILTMPTSVPAPSRPAAHDALKYPPQ